MLIIVIDFIFVKNNAMVCDFEYIKKVILTNPNKDLITKGVEMANKLMLHVHGDGIKGSLTKHDYFENPDIFAERNRIITSNADLFARVLQSEHMIFTAQGGYSDYDGLTDNQKKELNGYIDSIRYGIKLRKWVEMFALDAYRCDPMSVIYVEVSEDGKPYPTYKCISSIYDYLPNGRQLEYICFILTNKEALAFGIADSDISTIDADKPSKYFRFIDDVTDAIYKKGDGTIVEVKNTSIANEWSKVPAIIASDIPSSKNPQKFLSPLNKVIELADTFLNDRSVRDLQKKYSGFYKSIEPLLKCGTCNGEGYLSGAACPECTPSGADRGTGFKLKTKVADVARFAMDKDNPNPASYFAYIAPPVDVWNKQDSSLNDIENLIKDVYWGTEARNTKSNPSGQMDNLPETATKTLANLQPKYARLNMTADWAQSTENAIVNFIGRYLYPSFKQSNITYGRFYILESPNELIADYINKRKSGTPETELTSTLLRYYHSLFKENPIKLAIAIKMLHVEPFIHKTTDEASRLNLKKIDYFKKLYFSEWYATVDDNYLLVTDEDELIAELTKFATDKMNESETIKEPIAEISSLNQMVGL